MLINFPLKVPFPPVLGVHSKKKKKLNDVDPSGKGLSSFPVGYRNAMIAQMLDKEYPLGLQRSPGTRQSSFPLLSFFSITKTSHTCSPLRQR